MKNKVVINCCYGGYGLSTEAVDWLAKNGSEETKALIAAAGNKKEAAWKLERLPRHNHDIVACVEALGKRASGECADLGVVTINGNRYRIDEYDGKESVMTPEREYYIQIRKKLYSLSLLLKKQWKGFASLVFHLKLRRKLRIG